MQSVNWHTHSTARLSLASISLFLFCASSLAQEAKPQRQRERSSEARSFPTSRIRIPSWRLTDGLPVRGAFHSTVAAAHKATVRILADGNNVALGGIVDSDGWIITKASCLSGDTTCQLPDQRELQAKLIGIDRKHDLALLKVDATDLPELDLDSATKPKIGAWLATVGMGNSPLAVGVLGVESREIRHRAGVLGVQFDLRTDRPVIDEVFPDTAAAAAGLQDDDEMLSINGQGTASRIAFIERIREFSPGDQISLRVRRENETIDINALLKGRRPWRMPTREEFQNQLGSKLSQRRFGFPLAFQHDMVVKPTDCGGPVVNLDGQVVGFNIARAGRTETYAIPTNVIVEVVQSLKDEQK